jgi:hypothetical protein
VTSKKHGSKVIKREKACGSTQLDLLSSGTATSNSVLFVKSTLPTPTDVFATYWRFAKMRQDAFFAQFAKSRSTVEDPVIKRHRFTNVYRAADRVSQYLIRHVLYDREWSLTDLVFRLLVFKFFNKIETWEILERTLGPITWDSYRFEAYSRCLDSLMSSGKTVYSAAYIMPSGATAFGYTRKHQNHLKVIEKMMTAGLPERLTSCKSFESVFLLLCSFPTIGPFIGYQFAIDLNYSKLLDFSEDDFVQAGPGALDGISKCFSNLGDFSSSDVIRYMVDEQERAFEKFAPGFKDLWGRRLHLIDCQNLFCEVSKYSRVVHPEIKGASGRTRIKQLYRPSHRALEIPWFPPKWGINNRIDVTP